MSFAFGLYIKEKLTLSNQRRSNKSPSPNRLCDIPPSTVYSSKSVRFSDSRSTIYYTYSGNNNDRGACKIGDEDMGHQLRLDNSDLHSESHMNDKGKDAASSDNSDTDYYATQQDIDFDNRCRRNTKINKKRGYHSMAILVHYRSNF